MSFEMKYDRDGNPVIPKEPAVPTPPPEQAEIPESLDAAPEVEPAETPEPAVQEIKPEPVKSSAPQESWKILREKAEKAEKERDEAIRVLREIENRQQTHQAQVQEEDPISLDEDALVEGKHLSKVTKHIKRLEEQVKSYQQQTAVSATEAKIKAQYPDFDTIVSKENLDNLRYVYPEIAATINSSTDLYSKAISAYTMIKKLGIVAPDNYQQDIAQAQKNAAKPKPLASVSPQQGDSPLSKANAFANGKLSDELKKQLLKEMMEARNN